MKQGSVDIFGVRIDMVTGKDAVDIIKGWVMGSDKHMIFTPNIEFIMVAQKDEEFKRVLNKAGLAIPDSSRLAWAWEVIHQKNLFLRILMAPLSLAPYLMPNQKFETLTGVNLMQLICDDFSKKGFTVGLLGGRVGVAKRAAECLQKMYPGLKVVFADSGPKVDYNGQELGVLSANSPIRRPRFAAGAQWGTPFAATPHSFPKTDVLFVAFGQIKQEKWIANNLDRLPVKVAMGVGGSFDEIAGVVPKAPLWVSALGLKWLFRLITEPWRIKRQLVLPQFILKVILLNN